MKLYSFKLKRRNPEYTYIEAMIEATSLKDALEHAKVHLDDIRKIFPKSDWFLFDVSELKT